MRAIQAVRWRYYKQKQGKTVATVLRRPSFRRVSFDGKPKNRKPVRLTFKSVEEKDGMVWMRDQVEGNK